MVRVHLAPPPTTRPVRSARRPVELGSASTGGVVHFASMRTFRRGLLVGLLAVLVGVVVRLRGKGGVVPRTAGGWRELEGPDFR